MENGLYKYELHCHTGEVSRCADAPAAALVRLYKSMGYDGMVVTDHYSPMTFMRPNSTDLFPQKFTKLYLRGYNEAKAEADKIGGFTVLLGMEVRFYLTINDYLVYGMNEDFINGSGNLIGKYQRRFFRLADKNGMIMVQAHPFRKMMRPANTKYLHGAEVFNAKDSAEVNSQSEKWADENGLKIKTGGSDCHHLNNTHFGGILTRRKIETNEELLSVLRSGDYEIIKRG